MALGLSARRSGEDVWLGPGMAEALEVDWLELPLAPDLVALFCLSLKGELFAGFFAELVVVGLYEAAAEPALEGRLFTGLRDDLLCSCVADLAWVLAGLEAAAFLPELEFGPRWKT